MTVLRRKLFLLGALIGLCAAHSSFAADAPRSLLSGSFSGDKPAQTEAVEPTGFAIERAELGDLGFDETGILTAETGGFGKDLWQGMTADALSSLLPLLPTVPQSPAMHDLARRLLLTAADLPKDLASAEGKYLALRLSKLLAMGEADAALSLLAPLPPHALTPSLAQMRMDALLLLGDHQTACQTVQDVIRDNPTPYWQKGLIFCHLAVGDIDKARLGLSLLKEETTKDRDFITLVDHMLGLSDLSVSTLAAPTPIHLALLRLGKVRIPESLAVSDLAWVLKATALMTSADMELRLAAAERAERVGALPADVVRQLYTETIFGEEETTKPLTWAADNPGPKARALLYQTAMTRENPAQQAEIVTKALSAASRQKLFAPVARVFLPLIDNFEVSGELAWFARQAIPALLVSGQPEKAAAWLSLAHKHAGASAEAAMAAAAYWPLVTLAQPQGRLFLESNSFTDWRAVMRQTGLSERAVDRVQERLLGSLSALGTVVRVEDWAALLPRSRGTVKTRMPSVPLYAYLPEAAAVGQVGATVLGALVVLSNDFPDKVALQAVMRALSVLSKTGLDAEARRIAVDALLKKSF